MNRQNYFVHNGKTYYTGTIIKVRDWASSIDRNAIINVAFVYIDLDNGGRYVYSKINNSQRKNVSVPEEMFFNILVEVTDNVNIKTRMPIKKYRKDYEIPGLFIGWVWYIFIMGIAILFKDCIGIWALASIVFFPWRHKKLEKEGVYYEW